MRNCLLVNYGYDKFTNFYEYLIIYRVDLQGAMNLLIVILKLVMPERLSLKPS